MLDRFLNEATGLTFVKEYRFDPSRRWRFDFACVEAKIAVEIEGGVYANGRHTRGKGYINDMEKYNRAQELGWVVLRYTPQQQYLISTMEQVKNTIKNSRKTVL